MIALILESERGRPARIVGKNYFAITQKQQRKQAGQTPAL